MVKDFDSYEEFVMYDVSTQKGTIADNMIMQVDQLVYRISKEIAKH